MTNNHFGDEEAHPVPWQRAKLDYSAANEYMASHYRHLGYGGSSDAGEASEAPPRQYFSHNTSPDGTHATEDIFNARNGFDFDMGRLMRPTLDSCGFTLKEVPVEVDDWSDLAQVSELYLPKLERAIRDAFRDDGSSSSVCSISHIQFYQPMLRGEDITMGSTTSPVASLVHIDTDFGAHDAEGIVDLVENNRIKNKDGDVVDESIFPRESIVSSIRNGRRFAVVNAWRGVNAEEQSVGRAHLGLFVPQYNATTQESGGDVPRRRRCYPTLRPDRPRSKWYAYPNMASDEVLLFKQYDRRVDRPSDLWHCSLPIFDGEQARIPRRSFDIRAFVVFDEMVQPELDRYADDRRRPILTLEESGCFCDEQAESRRAKDEAYL